MPVSTQNSSANENGPEFIIRFSTGRDSILSLAHRHSVRLRVAHRDTASIRLWCHTTWQQHFTVWPSRRHCKRAQKRAHAHCMQKMPCSSSGEACFVGVDGGTTQHTRSAVPPHRDLLLVRASNTTTALALEEGSSSPLASLSLTDVRNNTSRIVHLTRAFTYARDQYGSPQRIHALLGVTCLYHRSDLRREEEVAKA